MKLFHNNFSLQLTAAIFYPLALSLGAEALVSITRVEEYLLMEEKDETNIGLVTNPKPEDNIAASMWSIDIDNISASWNDSQNSTLEEISIRVKPGQLCAIIGPVGSGKVRFANMVGLKIWLNKFQFLELFTAFAFGRTAN